VTDGLSLSLSLSLLLFPSLHTGPQRLFWPSRMRKEHNYTTSDSPNSLEAVPFTLAFQRALSQALTGARLIKNYVVAGHSGAYL
jgi:hypothetical protein